MSGENTNKKLTEFYQLRKGNIPRLDTNVTVDTIPKASTSENLDKNLRIENNSSIDSDSSSSNSNGKEYISISDSEPEIAINDNLLNDTSILENQNLDINMAEKKDLNITEALKFISTFDGNSEKLHQFLECADMIYDDLKATEYPKFLRLMKKLLTGIAYNETVKYITYEDWESLKTDLKTRFSEIRSKLEVSQELNTIFQKPNEDVRTFGSRVQSLLCQFNDICRSEAGPGSENIIRILNSQTALVSFQEGLHKDIKIIVKSANCKTLKESISKAVEEEVLLKKNSVQDNLIKKCQYCHKIGHTADKCFGLKNLKKHNSESKGLNSNIEGKPSSSSLNQSSSHNILCSYCKKKGHHIENCYSRKNSEARKSQNNSNSQNNRATTSNNAISGNLNLINLNSEDSGNSNRLDQLPLNRAVRAKDL